MTAILAFWAALDTTVLLMAQVMMPAVRMQTVAARTSQPPHDRCGMKRRISTRKASNVTRKVGRAKRRVARRYFGLFDGPGKCEQAARIMRTRVKAAAIGWMIRRLESECRALDGRVKSVFDGFFKAVSTQPSKY